jgi:hypothetical protein
MKLSKIPTEEAVALTKPTSLSPDLEAAWLGYKHSLNRIKGQAKDAADRVLGESDNEEFWKHVVEEVQAGLKNAVWKRDEVVGEMAKRGHGVPLSGESRSLRVVHCRSW